MPCATITGSETYDNYVQLLRCPQDAGLTWKLEDNDGICAQTQTGWVGWEYPSPNFQNEQKSLGFYLDTWDMSGWISPATTESIKCGISSFTFWKDTTSISAF